MLKDKVYSLIVKGASLSLLIRILGVMLMFCAHAMLARHMTQQDYGLFIYAINLVPLLSLLAQAGFQNGAIRYIPQYRKKPALLKGYLCFSHLLPLGNAIIIALLCLLASSLHFIPSNIQTCLITISWVIIAHTLSQISQQTLRAERRIIFSQGFEQLGLPLALLAAILFVDQITFTHAIYVYGFTYFAIITITSYLAYLILFPRQVPPAYCQSKWLKATLPMGGGSLVHAALFRLDILLLGWFLAADHVATYGAASRIAGLFIFLPAAISAITDPIISRYYHQKKYKQISALLRKMIVIILSLGSTGLLFFLFFGEWILLAFGEAYMQAKPILLILALGQVVNLSAGPIASILFISGHQTTFLKLMLSMLLLLGVSLSAVIPTYGAIGGAIVTTSALIIMNIILLILIERKSAIKIFSAAHSS